MISFGALGPKAHFATQASAVAKCILVFFVSGGCHLAPKSGPINIPDDPNDPRCTPPGKSFTQKASKNARKNYKNKRRPTCGQPDSPNTIWEASGAPLESSGRSLAVSRVTRSMWDVLGVSVHESVCHCAVVGFFPKQMSFTICF